jgi:GH15 family glucan-1,4-alpha-glucosidase
MDGSSNENACGVTRCMPLRIEDYALIGDSETAALVGRDGSIDWLCWPRFDSDACFAALLGTPEHGRWQIGPAGVGLMANQRYYRGDSLILQTRFETKDGVVRLVDFMPPRGSDGAAHPSHSILVRLVIGERGRVAMQMELVVRFGYGRWCPGSIDRKTARCARLQAPINSYCALPLLSAAKA